MATCDVCGDSISNSEMHTVKPLIIASATRKGWVPSRLPTGGLELAGIQVQKQQMWESVVSGNKIVDWGLCDSCFQEMIKWVSFSRILFLTLLSPFLEILDR